MFCGQDGDTSYDHGRQLPMQLSASAEAVRPERLRAELLISPVSRRRGSTVAKPAGPECINRSSALVDNSYCICRSYT